MKTISTLGNWAIPAIAIGCMRIANLEDKVLDELIDTAIEVGANFFDHADIYGRGGGCEEAFGRRLKARPKLREKMILQSKCGIRRTFYDFSKEHILFSVDESLRRMNTDYLDALVLHRPDALVEPEEVAQAFDELEESGKVRCFGVSNHNPAQMALLKKYVKQPLLFNQLQFSPVHTAMIDSGINVNTRFDEAIDRDGGVLDYCRLNDMVIQAWSPFQHGFIEGVFLDNPAFEKVNTVFKEIGERYGISQSAAVVAWLLRHPAKIQPIIGSTSPARIREIAKAAEISLTRPEWYEIYRAAGNRLP